MKDPKFKLIKAFPGMHEPVGTIFYTETGWLSLGTIMGRHSTEWIPEDYFEPFVGEFFERI
jgi:hypothetical protein